MTTAPSSFSVLIPAYRAGKTIAATLRSVAEQTLCPDEILVYEDGCFDDLARTVTNFAEIAPCPVRLLSCPLNGGVSRARNILLREATGEFIAFLDADDIWGPDHLSRAAEVFTSGADVVFSGVTFIDANGREIPGRAEPSAEQLADIAPAMFRYNFVQCTSTLSLRRAWISRTGDFDVNLSHGEDLDLWLRLLAAGAVWCYTGRCSCAYRKHPTSAMGQTLLVVDRMAAFYEKHLSNPLIPRATRRDALIRNRRTQARLHWRKHPAAAVAALRRLVTLQPWNPVYLCALPGVLVWSFFRHRPQLRQKPPSDAEKVALHPSFFVKIYASPCGTNPKTVELDQLRKLHLLSAPRLHEWCDSPQDADIIFLTNAQQKWGSSLEKHPLPKRFPEKCFALSEQWEPPFLLAGIYANAPRAKFGRGRFRTGSYALHHPDFHNAYIETYDYEKETPLRQPDLLASFLGRKCHPVRDELFATNFASENILVEDTSSFNAFTHSTEGKLEAQRRYFEICLRSKFILSPRGAGPNSIRLFESLKLGIAPVIISDEWLPCEGPDWNGFAIFIAEKEVRHVGEFVKRAEKEYAHRGHLARQAYEKYFSPASYFNYLVASAVSARQSRVIPERFFVSLWPALRLLRGARRRAMSLVVKK